MKLYRPFTLASAVLAIFFCADIEARDHERSQSTPDQDSPSSLAVRNSVPPGARIRVTAPTLASKPLVGTLVETTDHELVLAVPGRDRTAIPIEAVRRLEVSRGKCRWCAVGLGFLGGAVGFGIMVPPAFALYGEGSGASGGGYWLLALPVAGAALGVARGNRERWETVVEVPLRPAQRGLGQPGLGDVLVGPASNVGASVAAHDTVSPLSGALLRVASAAVNSNVDLAEASPDRQVTFSITPTNDRGVQARFSISWR